MQKKESQVFLSYPRIEDAFASRLRDDLHKKGFDLWWDKSEILGGDDWRNRVQQAIDACEGMIVVICPAYIRSDNCKKELYLAADLKCPIVPILLRDVEKKDWPLDIIGSHYIDFSHYDSYQSALRELTKSLGSLQRRRKGQIKDSLPPAQSRPQSLTELEQRYLSDCIRELEERRGILEYVKLSGKVDMSPMRYHPQPAYPNEFEHLQPKYIYIKGPLSRVDNVIQWDSHDQESFATIDDAVNKFTRFVLIGEPGAGKTTTLRHLVLETAKRCSEKPGEVPIPLLLYLPQWKNSWTFERFIREQWLLGDDPIELLAQGKISLYLDGLNEMGAGGSDKAQQLHRWLHYEVPQARAIVTCRVRDYIGKFELELPKILIERMDSQQINHFVKSYLKDKAEPLLRQIRTEHSVIYDQVYNISHLACNPYLLTALIYVYERAPHSALPRNYGALFRQLARSLWERERERVTRGWMPFERMENFFSHLAFAMIDENKPVDVPVTYALKYLHSEDLLRAGHSANLLLLDESQEQVRFFHQLMQEYFAGVRLGEVGLQKKLERREFDYDWDLSANFQKWGQVLIAYCGILSNADAVIKQLLEIDIFLAAHCIDTGIVVSDKVRRETTKRLIAGLRKIISAHTQYTFSSVMQQRVFLHALSKTGDRLAAEELVNCLTRNHDYMVRDAAAVGLVRMEPRLSVTALKKTFEALREGEEDWVYREAIYTLAAIRDCGVIPMIISLLLDHHSQKSRYAEDCLFSLAKSSLFEKGLCLALKDENDAVREYAARKLNELREST